MTSVLFWLNLHRGIVIVLMAALLWTMPFIWYFRNAIRRWINRGRPHSWSVNLVQKSAMYNGKEEVR